MTNSLPKSSEDKILLVVHMSFIEEELTVLDIENIKFKEQLSIMIEKSRKRKGVASSLQIELKSSLNNVKTRLALALETMIRWIRTWSIFENNWKILKWTSFSKLLSNISSKSNYNKNRLCSLKISPPYNPHNMYFSVANNILCLHCGRSGHLQRDCLARKASHDKVSVNFRQKFNQNKGPTPISNYSNLKNIIWPYLRRNTLIIPLSLLGNKIKTGS